MSQYIVSVIRTWVPIIVGSFIGWLLSLGVEVGEDAQAALTLALGALATALYYAFVRWLETKFPSAGILLGYIRQPVYVDPTRSPAAQSEKLSEAITATAKTPQ
jgi:ABC-type transport system involved in cytochrome c biogenesis permease component